MPRSPARRRVLLHESDFAEALAVRAREFMKLANALSAEGGENWTERRYDSLYRLATGVESFLDDHGARANRTFFRIRETVAILRWLAQGAGALAHLDGRLASYPVHPAGWAEAMLREPLEEALGRLDADLCRTTEALRREWVASGAEWCDEVADEGASEALASLALPADRNREEDAGATAGQIPDSHAARFVSRYLRFSEAWVPGARRRVHGIPALRGYMEAYCQESIARRFEAKAHNLQSEFDSVLQGGAEAAEHPELQALRSGASLCLHLLECATALTHLYERHDLHERHGESRALFEELVDAERLLDVVVNVCVIGAYDVLQKGVPLAQELLGRLTSQDERELALPEGVDMHARPLSLIVRVVAHHGTPVEMVVAEETASAASMMAMLVLIGARPQQRSFVFRGDRQVLEDLEALFAAGLGERGMDALPLTLAYLRN